MKWVSFSARYLVNVEDLNNVESAGNYVRHRRAPIIVKEGNTYTVTYVPAVSGEMIAHGYQMNLVEIAIERNLPVEELAKQGILIKRGAGDSVHKTGCGDKNGSDYELCVIEEDIVEDVAGFLNPDKLVKRTSNIAFSYMIPALDAVKASAVTSQFHVRYATKEMIDKYEKENKNIQSLYNVETASASYVLTGYLNLSNIGVTQNYPVKEVKDKKDREIASLDALMLTLTQFLFGAKRTRFNPLVEIEALVLSVSEKPFNLPPINGDFNDYLNLVKSTADSFSSALEIDRPKIVFYVKGVKGSLSNPVEVFKSVRG
ncbi:putative CRISPR-associated regulatory protein Csa2 [Sulfurisphaera tokodaii str. 7]|uniref:CRISPR-associated regulatory protein Csa2 n=1 Tax=Sulfurisphaera tokodaii (strain DSM 16993 / JCM 10545 / NBRC 100140 / 7) TaxID=273063 RepID=Q977B4_SULTO|nr:type I-A CRISPR-associated protein Cas7/Csa2 [Sulfurisphaera tokodaii]BAB64980.2 putative CRISPR-associated regulatory protein Csa2 [Sulfurisphaera tokodaii str. 7]